MMLLMAWKDYLTTSWPVTPSLCVCVLGHMAAFNHTPSDRFVHADISVAIASY